MKTEQEIRADIARLDRQSQESRVRSEGLLLRLGGGVIYEGEKVTYQQAKEIEEELEKETALQRDFMTRIFALDWVLYDSQPLPGFSQEALNDKGDTTLNASDAGLIDDSKRWAQPAEHKAPESVTELTSADRLALLSFDIEVMRNSEGTPFFDEAKLDDMLAEWSELTNQQAS